MANQLELYRWMLPVAAEGGLPDRLRAMESLVRDELDPAVSDPVFREHASAYHVRKHHGDETGSDTVPGVWLIAFAPPEAKVPLESAASRHLESASVRHGARSEAEEVLLHAVAADYRRGLCDASEIALELHRSPVDLFRAHQCFLIRLGCARSDPRFELHPYLVQHSQAYVKRSEAEPREDGLWGWGHEEFWARLFTPGPAPGLVPPLSSLWNIVVGVSPRGWSDPHRIAERLGIDCG